ncbi:hypothetical protein [Cytophaga aurantiaca]|uniref:hypothetical protein n=1 Tax=Cytophaga aurantiaca TaxID=29530 RepID=UPI0003AB099B|nr:hypothetical protein [Cytophaga aurantiaca]
MKLLYGYIFLTVIFLLSCERKQQKEVLKEDTLQAVIQQDSLKQLNADSISNDVIAIVSDTFPQIDTLLKRNATKYIRLDSTASAKQSSITKLPFESQKAGKDPSFILPVIDTIIYYSWETGFNFNFNDREELFAFNKYNNRLPDIYKYQVYYTQFYCRSSQEYEQLNICKNFVELTCGFLIFYDPQNKKALIVNVQNSYYIDSAIEMDFLIDSDYKILIKEEGFTDGDDGNSAMKYSEYNAIIQFTKNGKIVIDAK